MPSYPTSKLDKALHHRSHTTESRAAWAETAPRSLAPLLEGFQGSWAAQYGQGAGVLDNQQADTPAPAQQQINRLGQPGVAEINWRPYDWNTGRKGKYGASLLGHPISLSIVGPTVKSPFCTHQWRLTHSGGRDVLTLDNLTALSTASTPESLHTSLNTIEKIYGLTSLPESGLFLVISVSGSGGSITDGAGSTEAGGLGDGLIGDDGLGGPSGLPRTAIIPESEASKFEIFRVVAISSTTLTLDSSKRISSYYWTPSNASATPMIRAVTLFTPAATRLIAVPGSGSKGQETTFAFLPPTHSLNADLQPPRAMWETLGGFDPWTDYTSAATGDMAFYAQNMPSPNVLPLYKGRCRIQGILGESFTSTAAGTILVYLESGTAFDSVADIGRLVQITSVRKQNNGSLITADELGLLSAPELDRVIGFWEISDVSAGAGVNGEDAYILRRAAQIDPSTGVPFYFDPAFFQMSLATSAGDEIWMDFSLHEPLSQLFSKRHVTAAEIFANRLDRLIDPAQVNQSIKGASSNAGQLTAPDRAIWDTSSSADGSDESNADPGSLYDLGFRVVFFPARVSGGVLVPDFDYPIESNDLVLDPTLQTRQWIEVDYASGLVHLSCPPKAGTGCAICPTTGVLTATDNPRGEMVFFASCVPHSRESHAGIRITGGQPTRRAGDMAALSEVRHTDVHGGLTMWPLAPGQTIDSGSDEIMIKLNVVLRASEVPATGFVDLVTGDLDPSGAPVTTANVRASTWGYSAILFTDASNGGNSTLVGCFGGGAVATSTVEPTEIAPWTAILRRHVEMPSDVYGRHGTAYQYDSTWGQALRTETLRFQHGALTAESDGTVTVHIDDPRTAAHQELFAHLFSSWLLSGGEMTTSLPSSNDGLLTFSEATVLIQGVRSVLPAQQFQVGTTTHTPVGHVVYLDGANPYAPVYAYTDNLPLPGDHDVLLGRYQYTLGNVTTWTDLRKPLGAVDKRTDLTVGTYTGYGTPGVGHFNTLADAIAFIRETSSSTRVYPGQGWRIRVIGTTLEDAGNLPIVVGCRGLIIEGAMQDGGASSGFEQPILWTTDDTLFDLEGCEDIVFRNLVFSHNPTGESSTTTERNLFYNGGAQMTNVLFENIRLLGPAHSFLYCHDPGVSGTGMSRVTFRNCVATGLSDHAIRIDSPDLVEDILIEGCFFAARTASDTPTPALGQSNYGLIHIDSTTGLSIVVRDTVLVGGDIGIWAGGSTAFHIANCRIEDTDNAAIVVDCDHVTISNCRLFDVHSASAADGILTSARVGIHQTVASNYAHIAHNFIQVAGSSGTVDYAIYFQSNSAGQVLHANETNARIQCGTEAFASDNIVSTGDLRCLADCVLVGNRVLDPSSGDLATGARCRASGNVAYGALSCGNYSTFTDNWFPGAGPHATAVGVSLIGCTFGDPTDSPPSGTVTVGSDVRMVSCWLGDGLLATNADRVFLNNCQILAQTDMSLSGDDWVITGCSFEGTVADMVFALDGVRATLQGNRFDAAGWTVQLEDSGLSTLQEYVIGSNRLEAQSGTPRGGFWIVGNGCQITGNIVDGVESESASPDLYSIHIEGNNNVLTGNRTLTVYANGDSNVVNDNRMTAFLTNAANSGGIYNGNNITSSMTVVGSDHQVVGNRISGGATWSASSSVFADNTVGTTCQASGNQSAYRGNKVTGNMTVGGAAARTQYLNSNQIGGTLQFVTPGTDYLTASTLADNRVTGAVALNGDSGNPGLENCTVSGNVCLDAFSATYSSGTTFQGNRVTGHMTVSSSQGGILQANRIGGNLAAASFDNYVIVGNRVDGDISVDAASAGETDTGVLVGNLCANIANGGTNPTDGLVAVGNKVTGGAIFATSPATTTVIDSNVSD